MTSPGWLRWLGRIPFGLRMVVVCTAIGILLGLGGAQLASSDVVGHYTSPGPILISADQRTLAGTVAGRCATGSLEVRETAETVTVRLHMWPEVMIAPGSCAMLTSSRSTPSLGATVAHAERSGAMRATAPPGLFQSCAWE